MNWDITSSKYIGMPANTSVRKYGTKNAPKYKIYGWNYEYRQKLYKYIY